MSCHTRIATSTKFSVKEMFAQLILAYQKNLEDIPGPSKVLSSDVNPAPSSASSTPSHNGSFLFSSAQFKGSHRVYAGRIEAFLNEIISYKKTNHISDEHALRDLDLLLEGEPAALWFAWKKTVKSWGKALIWLRKMYGVGNKPSVIFQTILEAEQGEERVDEFITRLRALFAILPYFVPEMIQLEVVYDC